MWLINKVDILSKECSGCPHHGEKLSRVLPTFGIYNMILEEDSYLFPFIKLD